jgi:hypothetical protein
MSRKIAEELLSRRVQSGKRHSLERIELNAAD